MSSSREIVGAVNQHTEHYLRVLEHYRPNPEHGYRYYHMMINFRIDGRVDPEKFASAVHDLVKANPAFRSRFQKTNGSWTQVVEPESNESVFECRRLGNTDQDWRQTARKILDEINEQPFDVSRTPLVKVTLLLFPDATIFVTKFHHMICDGWGIIVALNQLLGFYEAQLAGLAAQIPTLPAEVYLGFASAQNAEVASPNAQRQLAWWDTYIKDHPFVSSPLPVRPHGRLSVLSDIVGPETTAGIIKLAERDGYHFSYLAHCAFLKALKNHTGLEDILLTFVRANRNDSNSYVVGNFADWIMVRHKLDLTKGIEAIAQGAQKDVAEAKENYLPYWKLVHELCPVQYYMDFGITPYCYDYLPTFAPTISFGGQASFYLLRELEVLPTRVTATDLFCRINVIESAEGESQRLGIDLIYHNGIIAAESAQRILNDMKYELDRAAPSIT